MTVVAIGSLHGSPGATTVSVGLAGCLQDAVVVEADCDGGVLAARLGLRREPGVVTFAADREPTAGGRIADHVQEALGRVRVVIGPESPDHATWLWRSAGQQLASSLAGHAGVVVVDVGRWTPSSPAADLFAGAALTAIVTRPRPDELAIVAAKLAGHNGDRRPSVILVGDRPYSAGEVSAELDCDVLGVVADDPRAVATLWDGGTRRVLSRSPFARSLRSLADAIAGRLARDAQLHPLPASQVVTQ